MAAVLVADEGAIPLRAAVMRLRGDFDVPDGRPMSWKKDVKSHERRRRAAEVLAGVPGIKICYVFAVKDERRDHSYKSDPTRFYNYVAMKTYISILWAARDWKGSRAGLAIRFGHVRHHDHRRTKSYLEATAAADPAVPDHMVHSLRWVAAETYLESQAADLFGGFLKSAIWPSGRFGYTEPGYLHTIWHLIRGSESCAIPLGMFSMPRSEIAADAEWLPCTECPKKTSYGSSGTSGGRST